MNTENKAGTGQGQGQKPSSTSHIFRPIMTQLTPILLLCSFLLLSSLPGSGAQSLFGGQCPEKCYCGLDFRGRMEVTCHQGRMAEIPTLKISPSTEVIRIVPPKTQPNHLNIGRFFKQFKKLEELHIVNSNIPNIGEHSFWGIQSLRVLNLTGNNISVIVESNFKGLVSLEVLDLSNNNVEAFVSASFQPLSKLRELDLSGNKASKLVERLFYNLHMLEVLDLSGNWLRELTPDVFRDIWRLKFLRCRRCGLKTINPLLYALLPELKTLDLGENQFKYLNKEEFGSLLHLQDLLLDGNQMSAITDETFRSCKLRLLDLSSNRIFRLDSRAFENATVNELILAGNKFESLDRSMLSHARANLTKLDLSRNPKLGLHSLSIFLAGNPQLQWLSLSRNDYEDIPLDLFEQQEGLEYLSLSGNYLTYVYPHQLTQLRSLRVLDLSHNKLKGMDEDVLSLIDRLHNFRELRLAGNPWSCDLCNISPLLKWVKITPLFNTGCLDPYGPHCLRCTSPPTLYDKAILNLDESLLSWCSSAEPASILADDPRLGLFIGCGLILLILVTAALAIILHTRWHAAHYYTHEEDRPEIGTPPLPPDYDHLAVNEGFIDNHYLFNSSHGGPGGNMIPGTGNGTINKSKMIATIDEMNFSGGREYCGGQVITTHLPPKQQHPQPPQSTHHQPQLSSFKCQPQNNNSRNVNGRAGQGQGSIRGGSVSPILQLKHNRTNSNYQR